MHRNPESAPCETLLKRMHPDLAVQSAGGGASGGACSCKASSLCMKHLTTFDLVGAAKSAPPSSLIRCDRYVQGCVRQSRGRPHGPLDLDDGEDVCAGSGGFGVWTAVDASLGDDPGKPIARRDLRRGALDPGLGNRGGCDPWAHRHCEALALGSWAQPAGVRMRRLAGPSQARKVWPVPQVSRL